MDLKEYQTRAQLTDQNPKVSWGPAKATHDLQKHEVIPLLGLVGEVGGLLSEYKKMLRDGAVYQQFPEQVAEELGDILWYVATVATKFGLDLDAIATANIKKTEDRWYQPDGRKLYDETCDPKQRLPRKFAYKFSHATVKGVEKLVLTDCLTGDQTGDPLSDNAYEDDGYRYHDVMHLAFAARFGWSPVYRKLLRVKGQVERRQPAATDDAEGGGRAQVIEEGIVAAAYVYADSHSFLEGVDAVDWQLLRHLKQMTANLEVKDRTTWEWNDALKIGFKIWRKLKEHKGGSVIGDLEAGTLKFEPPVGN